jgi:acyl-CoA synthetase (AMP-forming)/AMP-acid ligase II
MNKMNSPDSSAKAFFNISSHLKRMSRLQPYKRAVVYPAGRDKNGRITYAHLTFEQLDQESDCLAHGLEAAGISRGIRTILMVKPGLEFFALTFAVFRHRKDLGYDWSALVLGWTHIQACASAPLEAFFSGQDSTGGYGCDPGSTGPAKGAVYTHGNFKAQLRHIKSYFQITTHDIDLPTFPLFALFDPALGMTAVIPDMDPTKPARVNPANIIEPIINQGVTNMFASPALLNRVGSYGKRKGLKLPSLKRVVSAGAPVQPGNIEQFSSMLCGDAQIHTPYGATEAVPIVSIASNEILSETRLRSEQGYGMCVGRPINNLNVRIIKISDDPIHRWSDDLLIRTSEVGEIVVKGDLVTRQYFENPAADAMAKITDGTEIWHRMGDLGWQDQKARIWFCGRKSHRVITENETLFTIPCEAIFNNHPRVFRWKWRPKIN